MQRDIGHLIQVAFVILILGMVLTIGTMIATNFKTQSLQTVFTTHNVANETLGSTALVPKTFTLANHPIDSATDVLFATNVTSNTVYPLTRNVNYTIVASTGVVSVTSLLVNSSLTYVNASYSYTTSASVPTNASNVMEKVIVAYGTFADWINPLAFISVASVVILILVSVYLRLRGATEVAE